MKRGAATSEAAIAGVFLELWFFRSIPKGFEAKSKRMVVFVVPRGSTRDEDSIARRAHWLLARSDVRDFIVGRLAVWYRTAFWGLD